LDKGAEASSNRRGAARNCGPIGQRATQNINKEGRIDHIGDWIGPNRVAGRARILTERGEKPVLMDHAAQPHAIGQIVDLGKVTLIAGDVLRPLPVVDATL
jgi:hypothetical protein